MKHVTRQDLVQNRGIRFLVPGNVSYQLSICFPCHAEPCDDRRFCRRAGRPRFFAACLSAAFSAAAGLTRSFLPVTIAFFIEIPGSPLREMKPCESDLPI
ncbi:MAG: hypothetical protein IID45_08605 [Planctomycetes bacterium]|nr:hypothetical protein [Planctomycetota bacterium]